MRIPAPWTKRLAAILAALAAAALVAGTFLPYDSLTVDPNSSITMKTTAWALSVSAETAGPSHFHPPYFGIPFCLLALALLVGMALLVNASAAAKTLTIAVAAAAVATMAMLAVAVWSFLDVYSNDRNAQVDRYSPSAGAGLWVLLAGTVLAVACAIFACLPSRTQSVEDMDTPPMGFPAPVVHE
jgi:hypothetical protein